MSKEVEVDNTSQETGKTENDSNIVVPEEFKNVINDLCKDIKFAFPETSDIIDSYYQDNTLDGDMLFNYIKNVYPERFFDILYQNEEIFEKDSETNCEFLPGLNFKDLWNLEDVSDSTKEKLWKYLQLILFTSVGNIKDRESFGETAKLFEAIDENDFKDKLSDVMENIQDIFSNRDDLSDDENNDEDKDDSKETKSNNEHFRNVFENMPNPETLHDHISSMLDGKLGKLATEIAEETAGELDIDFSGSTNTEDVLKKMFKNPGKLMGLVKKVGSKLDTKLKSGQIDEKELMSEASDLMRKMKDMPGMENIEQMLKGMNIPGMGKKAKFNMNAFKNQMEKQTAREKAMEKAKMMRMKREEQMKKEEEEKKIREANYKPMTEEEVEKLVNELEFTSFSTGEKVEKSMRPSTTNNKKKKKKKNKK